jgi:dipeptidyl aminopeptidase/acylaminoacyl peptidase
MKCRILAASGYVVMYTNPRGSQGYGEKFADAITSKWGEPAMTDLMAAVDYAVSLGYVDEKQLGVTGGSYGGYMTNWIVTHTDRFKAAVTQRSVSNFASMFGTSDVGFDMQWEFKATPWEDPELYAKWSPITYIEKCKRRFSSSTANTTGDATWSRTTRCSQH